MQVLKAILHQINILFWKKIDSQHDLISDLFKR